MQKRKYKYLYQLICTSIILVVVPTLLFYNVFWKKSFEEINHLNAEYYNNVLTAFSGTFSDEVSEFKRWVIAFSINSRSSQQEGGIFYDGTEKMEEQPYYYREALQELSGYTQKIGYDNISVYYYEKDCVLTDWVKYSVDRYIKDGLGIVDERKKVLENFFSAEKYASGKIILAPLYDTEGKSEALLVGVCTVLGKDKESALIFYRLDYDDINFFHTSAQDINQEKYFILDYGTKEILFSAGATTEEYARLRTYLEENVVEGELIRKQEESSEYFFRRHRGLSIVFFIDASGETIQNNVIQFYHDMKVFFIYIIIIMFAVCIATVYANYKPMHTLLKRIKHKEKNEFETILNAWENQNDLLTEQRMMITDLLMNHLLYGIPISQKYIKKLGVSSKVTNYCVFLIQKKVLRASDVEFVTQKAEEDFGVLLFITDLTGEKSTVIIAFMEYDKSESIRKWLEEWCMVHIVEEYRFRMGCVVDKMDEIQKSFAECLEVVEGTDISKGNDTGFEIQTVSERVRNRTEINERLKEEVLNYLDANYTDSDLSQTQIADHFQISVYSLSKMFNNQIGMGFAKYINSKRIEYAKELLLTTDLSVKNIAGMVGVPDDNYFSRIFRKYTGLSPLEFRNENK